MKFRTAIDAYLADQRRYGRINSDRTEVSYRSRLECHAKDVSNRDPAKTGRDDVKRTLGRWPHPNTQRHAHAVLTSFYDWAMEEGHRRDNPARQVRKAKKRETSVYRLTRDEVVRILDASMPDRRRRWVAHLGLCAGVRSQEIRGMQAKLLGRPGFVHVSREIGKGHKERWIPVIPELAPVVEEILTQLGPDDYIFCGRHPADPPLNTRWREYRDKPGSAKALWELVVELAQAAGLAEHVHPHLLRHAFGDHVARYAGLKAAQAMLGHASVDTTQSTYVGPTTLDELAVSVHGFSYRGYPPPTGAAKPLEAPTGIEPVDSVPNDVERKTAAPPNEGGSDGQGDAHGPPRGTA